MVVDDVTDCIDNDVNDVIRLFTFGELFAEKPKTLYQVMFYTT